MILIGVVAAHRLLAVGETWFLKQWGESYSDSSARRSHIATLAHHAVQINGLDRLPSPEANIMPWLYGFLILAVAQAIMFLFSEGFMLVIIYSAGRQMFEAVLSRIAGATFRFYDVTVSIILQIHYGVCPVMTTSTHWKA